MLCDLTPVLALASRQRLDEAEDLTCVGAETLAELELDLESARFDALLLGASEPHATEPSRHLLDGNPRLKIMCVSPDGRQAVLHERRLERMWIKNVSFDRLFDSIRDACESERPDE